ncbi:MAG: GAF domain-containing protein [Deltaproteobacteria bacterium]|nr:GAF domain-containing protein [Deltaproteobacteria bacterium]
MDTLVQDAVEPLVSMAGADRIMIAIAQNDARLLIPEASNWDLIASAKGIPAPPVASLGTEAVTFESVSMLPPQISSRVGELPGHIAVVPLWAHAHLRGVIMLARTRGRFSPHVLKMLTTAGRQLALAVENSRLLADLQDSYRKLMDTQEDLIRAERLAALGQLSATMAHEIRNPLATIFSAISQIRKQRKPELASTLLDIAEEEASRLNTMVAELLKFARPRKPLLEEGELLTSVRAAVEGICAAKDVEDGLVEIDPASVDVTCVFDNDLLSHALDILLDNALAALENRMDGKVLVVVRPQEMGAAVEIRDNGVGIPGELMSKIYEPFFSTKPTGTGLGLPTVKRIAEDHRGSLEIESTSGTGTVVRLFIQTRQRHFSS